MLASRTDVIIYLVYDVAVTLIKPTAILVLPFLTDLQHN